MRPGDVLLANLPQADGRAKDRPVLCLCSVPQSRFQGRIGFISQERHSRLLKSLAKFLAAAA